MNEEDFKKFDKETWFRFMQRTDQLNQSLFDCLIVLERSVQIERLMARGDQLREQIVAVQDGTGKKFQQYIKLLQMQVRNDKKLNRLFKLQIGGITQ